MPSTNLSSKLLSKKGALLLTLAASLLVLLVASAATADSSKRTFALARIMDTRGETIGGAVLTQKTGSEKVRVFAWATSLTPGKHGIHIHAVGLCDPPAFTTAGGHFNPEGKKHGLENPEGAHGGDLPNVVVRPNGLGILNVKTEGVSLYDGPKSLFDADGSAIIIHADEDDQVTDPTGNSGARVACGVIRATR